MRKNECVKKGRRKRKGKEKAELVLVLSDVADAGPIKAFHKLQSFIFRFPGYIWVGQMLDELVRIGCHLRGQVPFSQSLFRDLKYL